MDLPHATRPESGKEPVATHALQLGVVHLALSWCLVGGVLAPPSAHAQAEAPRILVTRSRGEGPDERGRVAARVRARWVARGVDVRVPEPAVEPDERASLEEARRAYHDLRPEDARAILEGWLERLEASGGAGVDRAALLDGLVWLGLARAAAGDEEAANAALDRALFVDPSMSLDEATYAPPIRARLEARRASLAEARATLRVRVEPTAAQVVVDGLPIDEPGDGLALPTGRHLVRAHAPGHRPEGRVVELGPEGAEARLTLTPDPEGVLASAGPEATDSELASAARALGRALALLDVERSAGGWRLTLRDTQRDRRSSAGPEPILERAIDALLVGLDAPALATPRTLTDSGVDPWPWVGGIGAAVVVVAAVAIGLSVGLSSGPNGFSAVGMRVP